MQLRTQIEETFGKALFDRPLFYSYPHALRFELAQGGSCIERFQTSLQRALAVTEDVFSGTDTFVLCLRTRLRPGYSPWYEIVRELRYAEISVPAKRAIWTEDVPADDWAEVDEPEKELTLAFHAPSRLLQTALWCAVADELGVRPRLGCEVYLLNLAVGLAVYPYDDRGMDVVGPNVDALRALYYKHHALLLPYDLDEMQSAFGAL